MRTRALSPVVGTALLVALTVLLAATVGTVLVGTGVEPAPTTVRLSASVDADADRLSISHDGGDPVSVENLELKMEIDDQPLDHQPPIPFFAATGFVSGPTGPFNSATDDEWTAGETGTLRLAGTNAPQLTEGATVEITVSTGEAVLATIETTAA